MTNRKDTEPEELPMFRSQGAREAKTKTCSDPEYLRRYLREELDESEETRVQRHIGSCPGCQEVLERVAGDPTLWSDLREHLADAPESEDSPETAEDTLRQLKDVLLPTDDPQMLGRIGNYEVCGLVGRGSTGIVVKALEPRLNRYVAIKLMSPTYLANGAARRRFEREGRAIAAVSHEHVVPIYAVDDHRGLPYIVMKYIPGLSLLQRIEKDGPLDTCEVARVGLQVAQGLAAAHAQGIVHRDVKPANVILESNVDRAMVTDFGLARVADEVSMTRSGTITGTPQYMSPEQARGDVVDPRSDLFSLGSLMYAACAGRPPFRAETVFGVINRVCDTEPRSIREINPQIDAWLEAFVAKLMSKQPDERFQNASEVAALLGGELAHLQNPTSVAQPPRAWWERESVDANSGLSSGVRRVLVASGVAALAVTAFFFFDRGETPEELGTSASVFPSLKGNHSSTLAPAPAPASVSRVAPFGAEFVSEETQITWTKNEADWDQDASITFDQKLERSFEVGAGGSLEMNIDRGDVVVRPSELDKVTVTVFRRVVADTQEEAEAIARHRDLRFAEEDASLSLTAAFGDDFGPERQKGFEKLLYRIAVPRRFDPDVRSECGSITIGALTGSVSAEAEEGDVEVAKIDGSVWAKTETGDIVVREGCTSADLLAIGGDVYLSGVTGNGKILTSSGHVWLGENLGAVTAQTAGGNVQVHGLAGPLNVWANSGNILAKLLESPAQDVALDANDGSVEIRIGEAVAATLRAQGELEAPFPMDLVESGDGTGETWFATQRNGGGPRIAARSSNGTVAFRYLDKKEGLGGSGLGGSGYGNSKKLSRRAREKSSGEPRPGAIVPVALSEPPGTMDGYTLYLPVSHDEHEGLYPILVYLQGGYGVGGEIGDVNHWGLSRLIRDETDVTTERNRLLLDGFVVICPHIEEGQYYENAATVQRVLAEVSANYKADPERVFLTGLSRGGHGTWGLAERLPDTFTAIAPIGARSDMVGSYGDIADLSIWIAHNTGDGIIPQSHSNEAERRIVEAGGDEFLRINREDVPDSEYLEHSHVYTYDRIASHDAWTDLYTSVEFYRWLLAQGGEARGQEF